MLLDVAGFILLTVLLDKLLGRCYGWKRIRILCDSCECCFIVEY